MDQSGARRKRSAAGSHEQNQGLLGILPTLNKDTLKTMQDSRNVIRRKSSIGDVKTIDPAAERKDLSPERRPVSPTNLVARQPDLNSKGTSFLEEAMAEHGKYEAIFPNPKMSPDPQSFSAASKSNQPFPAEQDYPSTQGTADAFKRPHGFFSDGTRGATSASGQQKEAPLPLSTGCDQFSGVSLEGDSCDEKARAEFGASSVGFVQTGTCSASGRMHVTVTETYAEAARRATEETWALVCSVYEWLVTNLL